MYEQGYVSGEPFDLKEARRELQSSLEVLLAQNLREEATVTPQEVPMAQSHDSKLQAKATKLMQYMNSQIPLFDDTGRSGSD